MLTNTEGESKIVGDYYLITVRKSAECIVGRSLDRRHKAYLEMVEKLLSWYIVGLVDGEGCFAVTISNHKTKRLGKDARMIFEIEMRGDERSLLERLQYTWNCGLIYDLRYPRYGWKPHVKYAIKSHKDIFRVLIPFFKKYPLQGKKRKDFEDFCRAAEVFRQKRHLTKEGIKELEEIRKFMNRRRPFEE